jgi:hypothetical protein
VGRTLDLRGERGLALPMALGIVTVFAIAGTSVLFYSVQNQHQSDYSNAGQVAYRLAEAGMNDAFSVLAANYPATYPGNANLLPGTTASYSGGTVTYSGTLNTLSATWTVRATSTARNPTGAGSSSIHRTLTAMVPVNLTGTTSSIPPAWNWVYSGATGSACDLTLQQSVELQSPLYVAGNLCMQNTSTITQPAGATGNRLVVGGKLTLSQTQNSVGSSSPSSKRLSEVHILGGCQYKNNTFYNPCQPNLSTSNVWVQAGGFYSTAPNPAIPAPTVDWYGNYQRAAPGPFRSCFSSSGTPPTFEVAAETASAQVSNMNADVPGVFNLTPSSSYTCQSGAGELSWNATTRVLTANGTIFIDGSATIDTSWAGNVVSTYTGQAVLYVYGTVLIKNAALCAVVQGSGCNQTNGAWDPNHTALIIGAHGNGSSGGSQGQVPSGDSIELVSASFQGGLYGTNAIDINTTSQSQGPLVSPSTVTPGQTGTIYFPSIQFAPIGLPGNTGPLPDAQLGTPMTFTG